MTAGIEIRCSIQLSYECDGFRIPYFVGFSRQFRPEPANPEKNGWGPKSALNRLSGHKVPDKSPDSFIACSQVAA